MTIAGGPATRSIAIPERVPTVLVVAQPFMLSAAFVLQNLANANATFADLWRPLVASQIVMAAVVGVLWLALRRADIAALLAGAALAALANYTLPAFVLIGVALWWALVTLLRRLRHERAEPLTGPTRIAVAFSLALFAVGVVSVVATYWPQPRERAALPASSDQGTSPDIYVLLLDGYPRADTLEEAFGIDNSPFLSGLSDLGFEVADEARTNYNKTWLTVASLLDARYVNDLPEMQDAPPDPAEQMRMAHQMIEGGAVLDALEDLSYQVISITSRATTTDVQSRADVRSTGGLTTFEIALLSHSAIARVVPDPFLDFMAADQRNGVYEQLRLMTEVAGEDADRPRLVLTHVMAPHLPFVLGQDADYLDGCFPYCDLFTTPLELLDISEGEFGSRLKTQLDVLNAEVLDVLGSVVDADPNAIVIVMSDHGIRHHVENWDEHFDSLFAARSQIAGLFPDDVSPVNVFRRILSRYFDADLPDLPYQAWRSDWNLPLVLTRHR